MIVECYSADVYCDSGFHRYLTPGCYSLPDSFTGKNKKDTDRQRKWYGWERMNGKDICPACASQLREQKERNATNSSSSNSG